MQQMKTGFVTMTFDCCHQGHFDLLRGCKQRCEWLIVGLTTDERVLQEKRQPILTYDQRFAILNNCQWVDEVIPNNGEPKAEMRDKLQFDVLFSGDDYYTSTEFQQFRDACPNTPVIFLPRNMNRSSSKYIDELMDRFYKSQRIVAPSIYGYIYRQGYGKPFHVTKCLPYSKFEVRSKFASNDVFGFYKHFDTLPRNWKSPNHVQEQPFPMISGIHSNREVIINEQLKLEPWCTYVSHSELYNHDITDTEEEPHCEFKSHMQFAHYVCHERSIPYKIVQIVQHDAGMTFEDWCKNVCETKTEFDSIVSYVRDVIIKYLESNKIVHSDIHPRNVLVHPITKQVSLIDFGWVTASMFELCEKERKALCEMLAQKFDWNHFQKSLLLCSSTAKWMDDNVTLHITISEEDYKKKKKMNASYFGLLKETDYERCLSKFIKLANTPGHHRLECNYLTFEKCQQLIMHPNVVWTTDCVKMRLCNDCCEYETIKNSRYLMTMIVHGQQDKQ